MRPIGFQEPSGGFTSRLKRGVLALALLVGAGAAAEAHKAPSKAPRPFGSPSRPGPLHAPDILSLPHGQAFAPSLPPKTALLPPKLPAFEPPPVKFPPPPHEPGFGKLPIREIGKTPQKLAGLPTHALPPQAPQTGWDAVIKPGPVPGIPKPSAAGPTPPPPGLEPKRPGKAIRHVFDKLRDSKAGEKRLSPKRLHLPFRLGAHRPGELPPPVGTFKAKEVLAVNLTAEGHAKAIAGGFAVVGETRLPGLGVTLTHLVPPASVDAVSAREQLFDLVPDGGFLLNRVYASYRLESGRHGGGGSAPVQPGGGGCPAERCFGGALIKWQPALSACARDLKIGMIDTGFDKAHPALAGVRHEYREFLPDGATKASPNHGTSVLSLLAGNADSGTPGLIPEASFVLANAFFADADGQSMSDTAQMVRALDWLKRSGVKVVNLSLAGPEDELVHHAVRELTKSGAVVIAAAGNDGPGAPPSYPAAYPEVIAVTAVDRKLAAYRYAGRGSHIDLAAPGVEVWTAVPGRREGPQTGTSFAVPYVTAVVAVSLSGLELAPDGDALAPKRRVLALLQGSVKSLGSPGRDSTFGEGLVQAPPSCPAPAPVITASLTAPPKPEPWAGIVKRAVDTALAETASKAGWSATVRPVAGD